MADPRDELLTDEEHTLVANLGRCAGLYANLEHPDRPREADVAEFVALIHALQARVLARAASRAYPNRYRLM